jgi:hypothetical protein
MKKRPSSSAKSVFVTRGIAKGEPDRQVELWRVIDEELPHLLGVESISPTLRAEILQAVGLLTEGKRHLNTMPRATDYVRIMHRVRDAAIALEESLPADATFLHDALQAEGYAADDHFNSPSRFNLEHFRTQLTAIVAAAERVRERHSQEPASDSKGRRANVALHLGVAHLRRIFRKHQTHSVSRSGAGAVQKLSAMETNERHFVNAIAKAALGLGRDLPKDVFEATVPPADE